jgi:two-component system sensor histidine kinase VicK
MSQNSHHPSYLVGHMVDASRDDDFNHLLEKQLESLDAVTFMLAHELSGPVANIMGLAEMLKIERDGQSPAEHEFAINQIYNFGGEILTLARGLVSLLELQLSQRQLIKKPVVLRQLLSGLVDNFYLKSDEPKIIYDWQHYPEKAEVAADAEKLSKAVEELLVMMLKHTQENEKIVLSVEELQHQNVVCIFIIAETTRLPEEDIRLILEEERKLRVNDVKGRQLSGKLELITAKEIMELHHGTLELYARGPLRGFRLSLPLQTS